MMHSPSADGVTARQRRSFLPVAHDHATKEQVRLAISTLAIALLLAAAVIVLIVRYV